MNVAKILSMLAAASVLAACGGSGGSDFCSAFPTDPLCQKTTSSGNACSQGISTFVAGYDLACAGYPDCCFCTCWQAGHQAPDGEDPCTCMPLSMPPCDEELAAWAQACLDAPEDCRQEAVDNVDYVCGDWIED